MIFYFDKKKMLFLLLLCLCERRGVIEKVLALFSISVLTSRCKLLIFDRMSLVYTMKFRIGIYSNVMMFQQVLLEILLQFKSLKHYVF